MNISTTNTELLAQLQTIQKKESTTSSDFSKKLSESSDLNNDNISNATEVSLSAEVLALDLNSAGNSDSNDLTQSISSKLQEIKYNTSSSEEFGEFLTQLGLLVPETPTNNQRPNVSNIASSIFSSNNVAENGSLSISQLGVSSELFSTIDNNSDGSITKGELVEKLTSLFNGLEDGTTTSAEFEDTMSALGAVPPSNSSNSAGSGGGESSGGGGGGSASSEEYEAADTNEDGTVSAAEYAAYYGTEETSDTKNAQEKYTMDLVSTLVDAVKEEAGEKDMELSQFKDIMKMVNNEVQNPKIASKLNEYLSNLG